MKEIITSANAPAAIGPYSQAVKTGNLVFLSGMLPIDPLTGEFAPGQAGEQTEQILKNIKALLADAGLTLDNVVKTTVFLQDMQDFAAMNTVYSNYFSQPYPARSAVAVKSLPKNALVEIEVIANI
ncbi:RidA family protein [Bacteroidales bacterium OttesenSCG-928-M11]|nr:RidA family protein [Bacteroidales bacterium OttesenSCG-928-M11]